MSITLLKNNVVIEHKDLNPLQKKLNISLNMTGLEYIKNYVKKTSKILPKKIGDKVYIIEAGTGSGKSAALPPALIDYGKRIAISVPTRVVAESVPINVIRYNKQFVFGKNIGFQTSIDKYTPPRGLVYTTPGTLLQQILSLSDKDFMKRYSIILIDEVHQHSIVEDFLLYELKRLITNNLKDPDCPMVFLLSATMEPKKYMEYFDTTHYIHIKGSDSKPIKEIYPEGDVDDLLEYCIKTIKELPDELGDCLIFLPSVRMIKNWALEIENNTNKKAIQAYSANMSDKSVLELFVKPEKNRIILATNAAETGVTFPYLKYVIDTGIENFVSFNPVYKSKIMLINSVTKSSAQQRRGRVGRVIPGTWYPCFTKKTYETDMIKSRYPEILVGDYTINLLNYLVKTYNLNINNNGELIDKDIKEELDLIDIPLINKPSIDTTQHSLEKLYILGMIDISKNYKPTYLGYLTSSIMPKFDIEIKKTILSSYSINKKITKFLLILGCCLTSSIGIWPNVKDVVDACDENINHIEFLSQDFYKEITIFQLITNYINYKLGSDLKSIKKFLEDLNIYTEAFMNCIKTYYELTESLFVTGLPFTNAYKDSFIWDLDKKDLDDIKFCIYEGYKMNIIEKKNDRYYTHYKNIPINKVKNKTLGTYTIINELIYKSTFSGDMGFVIDRTTLTLDISNFDKLDIHYLY